MNEWIDSIVRMVVITLMFRPLRCFPEYVLIAQMFDGIVRSFDYLKRKNCDLDAFFSLESGTWGNVSAINIRLSV